MLNIEVGDLQMDIKLYWCKYKLLPYEKKLGIREVISLLNPEEIIEREDCLSISGDIPIDKIKRLTYFERAEYEDVTVFTNQFLIEQSYRESFNSGNRQITRYSVHGLHEYKGKFNPQVVRTLINLFNIEEGQKILDPFCGSGTSLVEGIYSGVSSIGTDINKLAVFIANTKIKAMQIDIEDINNAKEYLIERFHKIRRNFDLNNLEDSRIQYLKKWFLLDNLYDIECLRKIILEEIHEDIKDVFLVILSNLLREYSLQEPADLRIRRRKSPLPDVSIIQVFGEKVNKFIEIQRASRVMNIVSSVNAKAINCDIRNFREYLEASGGTFFDAAITSPPYATALPYIDTQRLSLVWLGLCNPDNIMKLERTLIGSRELSVTMKKELEERLLNNTDNIPNELWRFCLNLNNSLAETDGFRRKAVPMLLYRYFADMAKMFINVRDVMNNNSPFALIVGHNHTVIGGTRYDIDTPRLLVEIAISNGWAHEETIPLETYTRYGINQKNAISQESLIILRS